MNGTLSTQLRVLALYSSILLISAGALILIIIVLKQVQLYLCKFLNLVHI